MSAFDAVDGSSTGTGVPLKWELSRLPDSEEPDMQTIKTIGLDIASQCSRSMALTRMAAWLFSGS